MVIIQIDHQMQIVSAICQLIRKSMMIRHGHDLMVVGTLFTLTVFVVQQSVKSEEGK